MKIKKDAATFGRLQQKSYLCIALKKWCLG